MDGEVIKCDKLKGHYIPEWNQTLNQDKFRQSTTTFVKSTIFIWQILQLKINV